MVVLAISHILYPLTGGASRSLFEILRLLSKKHTIVMCSQSERKVGKIEEMIVENVPTLTKDFIEYLVSTYKPHVVFTQLEWAPKVIQSLQNRVAVLFFARDLGYLCCTPTQTVQCSHSCLSSNGAQCTAWTSDKYHRSVTQTRRKTIGLASAVIANSCFMRDMFLTFSNPKKVFVSYPLVDPALYVSHDASLHRKYITLVKPTVSKGLARFYEIAKSLPNLSFLAVGGIVDELGKELRELPNVVVEGFVNDMRPIYGQTKLLLMPSIVEEAFGRAALEAMWNGVPVIGSNRGGIPEVIGDAGIIVKDTSIDQWREAIHRVFRQYESYCNRALIQARTFNPRKQLAVIEYAISWTVTGLDKRKNEHKRSVQKG